MSEKPVAAKLLIKPGERVWLSDPSRCVAAGAAPRRRVG